MGKRHLYTSEQKSWLKQNYSIFNYEELTKHFNKFFNENRTVKSIKYCVWDYKLSNRNFWSKDEDEFFKEFYPVLSNRDFLLKFNSTFNTNRSLNAIKARAIRLKIQTLRQTTSKTKSNNMLIRYPVGHIKDNGRTLYIKINSLPGRKVTDKYIPLSIYVLEQNGIKLKSNQCVKYKDNNYKNCSIDNLIIISYSTRVYMNDKNLWNKGEITEAALKVGELLDKIKEREEE